MITRIVTSGLRGKPSLDVKPSQFTAIGGPHGSGKTTLIMAAHLALNGYVPGQDKKGAAIMANCPGDEMGCAVEIDGHTVGRRWTRTDKGISETVKVDGEKASGKSADGMIRMALGHAPAVFDGFAFWSLSDREKRKAILSVTAGDKAEQLLDLDAKPRARLNTARADRQAAEKALANATASLSELPTVAGDLASIQAKLTKDRQALAELRDRISTGDQADEERKRLLALIQGKDAVQEELARLRTQVKVIAGEQPKEYATAGILKAIKDAWTFLAGKTELIGMVDAAVEKLDWAVKCCEAAATWPEQERAQQSLAKSIGILEQKQRDANAAATRIKSLPESPGKDDRTAITGIESRIKEASALVEGATRRAQVARMVEQAKQQAEKCAEAEEKAKTELADAATKMSEALTAGTEMLRTRAGAILPEGMLEVISTDTQCDLAWDRPNVGSVLRRALSGSERVVFDAAVAHALMGDNCTAFLDAGECSNDALISLAPLAGKCKCQVVLCRWTDSSIGLPVMDGWERIQLK